MLDKALRVLVVDDSAFMRRAIERLLSTQRGMVVVGTAADGIEAVQRTLELRPDVITMDVEMPRLDGVAAVRRSCRRSHADRHAQHDDDSGRRDNPARARRRRR